MCIVGFWMKLIVLCVVVLGRYRMVILYVLSVLVWCVGFLCLVVGSVSSCMLVWLCRCV